DAGPGVGVAPAVSVVGDGAEAHLNDPAGIDASAVSVSWIAEDHIAGDGAVVQEQLAAVVDASPGHDIYDGINPIARHLAGADRDEAGVVNDGARGVRRRRAIGRGFREGAGD